MTLRPVCLFPALTGYALAALLLVSSHFVDWLPLVFPLWVLVLSITILIENLRRAEPGRGDRPDGRKYLKGRIRKRLEKKESSPAN